MINQNQVSIYILSNGFTRFVSKNGDLSYAPEFYDFNTLAFIAKRLYAIEKSFCYYNKYHVVTPISISDDTIEAALQALKNLYFA